MTESTLTLPLPVAMPRVRAPQENIPQSKAERESLLRAVRAYAERERLVPPLPMSELRVHAAKFVAREGFDPAYAEFAAVLLSNELWRETLATIPYERRLLLMPKCLRIESKCPAPFDEFGLLCKKCGLCSIQDLQVEAERLGYAVLVAEGSPIVMALIDSGKIDAIVGISCLNVLEKAYPHMEAAAIPGIALPLLQDDCVDTSIDLDWVWETIHLNADDETRRMDLTGLREEVDSWFAHESLARIMGPADGRSEEIAREWLGRAGKRWRPFLAVATRMALSDDPTGAIPEDLRKVAVAVECFHKASLVHDDIEDEDATRYGEPTLHAEHGVPVALNVGDCLIGEGYRLLAECAASPDARARMLAVAARGQRTLCQGQGEELLWTRAPRAMKSIDVLEIHRRKTAPAFEVALQLGALHAGVDRAAEVEEVLREYSEAVGLAYQIRDDIEDFAESAEADDVRAARPTLPLALGLERAKGDDAELLRAAWERKAEATPAEVRRALIDAGVEGRARELLEAYKEQAIGSLRELENANLKGLLRRVIGKIFNEVEIKGWCREFEVRNGIPTGLPRPAAEAMEPEAVGFEPAR